MPSPLTKPHIFSMKINIVVTDVINDLTYSKISVSYTCGHNIGMKHVFGCINIRWVPRKVLKPEGGARGFQHLPRNTANVNARKTLFGHYYCINVLTLILLIS